MNSSKTKIYVRVVFGKRHDTERLRVSKIAGLKFRLLASICVVAFVMVVGLPIVALHSFAAPTPGVVTVVKKVVNTHGGTKTPNDFIMYVFGDTGVPGAGFIVKDFPGDELGTNVLFDAATIPGTFTGKYNVTESNLPGYTASYSSGCNSTISVGESKTCTVTNSDSPAIIKVVVNVVNDNGGNKTPVDFSINLLGTNVIPSTFVGSATGTDVILDAGSYSVSVSDPKYSFIYTSTCSGNISVGQSLVCTITANDNSESGGGGSSTPTGADITINKIASLVTANAHDTFTYTLTVTNNGPETASSVSVSDVLDSKVTFVSASSSMGSYASSTGEWLVGDLANGQSAVLEITVSVNASVSGTTIPNIATASSTTSDPSNSNNTSSVNVTVNTSGGGGGSGSGGGPAPSGGGSSGGSGVPTVPSPTPTGQGEVLGTSTLNTTMPTSGLSMPANAGEVLGAATTAQLPRTGAGWLITLLSAVVAGIVAFGVSGYRLKF